MKVAFVYDRVNKWGGAERVLLALHEIWPDAPLYTSVYDKKLAPWAKVFDVRTSFLQNTPLPKNAHEYYPFLMGIAFESFNFDEFDVVISVTHEFAKAILTKPGTLHICYCLTPVGYLWSGHDQYFSGRNKLFRTLTDPVVRYLRWYDKIISNRPDEYIAISNVVSDRISKYYGRKSAVIYPPVNLPGKIPNISLQKTGGYFLVVSRLVPNKRIDIAVETFNKLGWPLKIIGCGKSENKLKNDAKNNIEFLGNLTDEQVARYYESCTALIVPGEEDFGIVSVEAQSFGKPVIAYGAGGSLETVIENKTGYFFREQTAESLTKLLSEIDLVKIKPGNCIENSERFAKQIFKADFEKLINKFNAGKD